jgi:hypothetical protein
MNTQHVLNVQDKKQLLADLLLSSDNTPTTGASHEKLKVSTTHQLKENLRLTKGL